MMAIATAADDGCRQGSRQWQWMIEAEKQKHNEKQRRRCDNERDTADNNGKWQCTEDGGYYDGSGQWQRTMAKGWQWYMAEEDNSRTEGRCNRNNKRTYIISGNKKLERGNNDAQSFSLMIPICSL